MCVCVGSMYFFHGENLIDKLVNSEAPVAAVKKEEEPRKKPECYGIFCLTYDLKAVSILMHALRST